MLYGTKFAVSSAIPTKYKYTEGRMYKLGMLKLLVHIVTTNL
jgi:hypothetical protein